jgi:hypothetical protein
VVNSVTTVLRCTPLRSSFTSVGALWPCSWTQIFSHQVKLSTPAIHHLGWWNHWSNIRTSQPFTDRASGRVRPIPALTRSRWSRTCLMLTHATALTLRPRSKPCPDRTDAAPTEPTDPRMPIILRDSIIFVVHSAILIKRHLFFGFRPIIFAIFVATVLDPFATAQPF